MILIIGANGSMGRRYRAICDFLNEQTILADVETTKDEIKSAAKRATHAIIASPTDTHLDYIWTLSSFGFPVLCEKPLTRGMAELRTMADIVRLRKVKLTMMMQYKMLDHPSHEGPSSYDYFRTGNDGLNWDCLQIIGLARDEITHIGNRSPMWTCMLNGQKLDLGQMDRAYVHFVQKWLAGEMVDDIEQLIKIHEKVANWNG